MENTDELTAVQTLPPSELVSRNDNPLGLSLIPPDGYEVMWKNLYYFEAILGEDFLDLSNITLKEIEVYGFKFCRANEWPELIAYEWKGIICYKDVFLCQRTIENHPDQTMIHHAIEKEYFKKMKDLGISVTEEHPRDVRKRNGLVRIGGSDEI